MKIVIQQLETASSQLEAIKDEEDDSRSNMPESFEYTEAYEQSEACSDILGDAISDIECVINNINNAL